MMLPSLGLGWGSFRIFWDSVGSLRFGALPLNVLPVPLLRVLIVAPSSPREH